MYLLCRLKMYKNEPSIVDASIGEQVRLPCRVESSPSLTIEWQKDGHPISSARQVISLTILLSHFAVFVLCAKVQCLQ